MITFTYQGDFSRTEKFLMNAKSNNALKMLHKYGAKGVAALAANTPVNTGKTASSWSYTIEETESGYTIYWSNSNVNNHVNIALILQYGHGTGTGGYVEGIDYINPSLQPVFDQMAKDVWVSILSFFS